MTTWTPGDPVHDIPGHVGCLALYDVRETEPGDADTPVCAASWPTPHPMDDLDLMEAT